MLLEQLKGTRAHLDELWARIDATADGILPVDQDSEELAREELDEMPLEIVWEMGESFAVVLGTGGPHIEIRGGTRHDGAAYSLHGYWGGEHVTISGESITRTGEYFRELVQQGYDGPGWS
jgi:hypothetical protein